MNDVFYALNGLMGTHSVLDGIGLFLAEYLIFFLVGGTILVLRKEIRLLVVAFASGVLARFGFVELVRHLFPTDRPFVAHEVNMKIANIPFFDPTVQSSFPSGHTAFAFALSFVVFYYHRRIGILFLFLSLLMGLSRVFIGVHWPIDILGGIIVGGLSAFIVILIAKRTSYIS